MSGLSATVIVRLLPPGVEPVSLAEKVKESGLDPLPGTKLTKPKLCQSTCELLSSWIVTQKAPPMLFQCARPVPYTVKLCGLTCDRMVESGIVGFVNDHTKPAGQGNRGS